MAIRQGAAEEGQIDGDGDQTKGSLLEGKEAGRQAGKKRGLGRGRRLPVLGLCANALLLEGGKGDNDTLADADGTATKWEAAEGDALEGN